MALPYLIAFITAINSCFSAIRICIPIDVIVIVIVIFAFTTTVNATVNAIGFELRAAFGMISWLCLRIAYLIFSLCILLVDVLFIIMIVLCICRYVSGFMIIHYGYCIHHIHQ